MNQTASLPRGFGWAAFRSSLGNSYRQLAGSLTFFNRHGIGKIKSSTN